MDNMSDLKAKLGLPPVSQIGLIVEDVDKVAGYYSSLFGVGPWTIYDFAPHVHIYNGEQTYAKIRMGKAMWGNVELELLRPLEGVSPHMDWYLKYKQGLHHLGFFINNYDELYGKFIAEGFKPLLVSSSHVENYNGDIRICYFDTDKAVGVLFEIIWKSWLPECQPK
jgi:methylmalonyl-CoA/ethylmalonyl-CoA epimerase